MKISTSFLSCKNLEKDIKRLNLTLKEIGVPTAPQSYQYIERIELWK